MPQLKRQPFVPKEPPAGLKVTDEVFYCKVTNEVFVDYQEFFERTILCNSLVWSCSLTGRSGLTYQEAIESEENVRKQLGKFPESLLRPILFLVTLHHDCGLGEMIDNVHSFIKDRYFIGETVELLQDGRRKPCRIMKVMAQQTSNGKSKVKVNGGAAGSEEVICLDSDSDDDAAKPAQQGKMDMPSADTFQYVVQETEKPNVFIVRSQQICRKKGLLSHDKCKMLLKEFCHVAADGSWKVKAKHMRKYSLTDTHFGDFFAGSAPVFLSTGKSPRKSQGTARSSATSAEDEAIRRAKEEQKTKKLVANSRSPAAAPLAPLPEMTLEQWEEMRNRMLREREMQRNVKDEERRRKKEADKQQRLEERAKEREKKLEEKRQYEEQMREWSRPRDDLLCDDLQPLPVPTPIHCDLPAELFGDAMMVVEFLSNFGSIFELRKVFANGITLGDVVKAVTETGMSSTLSDLLMFLLNSVFALQEQEMEEEQELEKDRSSGQRIPEFFDKVDSIIELIEASKQVSRGIQQAFGNPLRQLQLDSFTLTEVLRLHLLVAGSQASENNRRYRYQERGAFSAYDDAGLEFRQLEPGLINTLAEISVYDLTPGDKLKLVSVLVHQLLTYCSCRDMIDDAAEKVKQGRSDLRLLQAGELRREREWVAFKYKKSLEDRLKPKDGLEERDGDTGEKKIKPSANDDKKKRSDAVDPFAAEREERKSQRLKVKDDEKDLPLDNIDWSKVTDDDRRRMRDRFAAKEADTLEQIDHNQSCSALLPLGEDRVLRRYWVFRSTGGVFVEDPCAELPVDWRGQREETESSDKENVKVKTNGNGVAGGKMTTEELMGVRGQHPWAFFSSVEEVSVLMAALNKRGFRESQLQAALQERHSIVSRLVTACPVTLLTSASDSSKQRQSAALMLELSLRDRLLDLEERIYVGGLGSLTQVDNRVEWRAAIENDRCVKEEQGDNGTTDRPDTGSYKADTLALLVQCLVSIVRGIDSKYLTKPLGDVERDRKKGGSRQPSKVDKKSTRRSKKRDDASDNDSDDDNHSTKSGDSKTPLQCWEDSLRDVTNLSQVFLHLALVEDCVLWSRSALKASCRICRRRGDGEKMLLCDSCNLGFHMYCLKPVVKSVPEGDWFCPNCRPKSVVATPRKSRKSTVTEESSESEEEEEEDKNDDSDYQDDSKLHSQHDTADDDASIVSDNDEDASQMSDNDSVKSSPLTASLIQPTKVRIISKFKLKVAEKVGESSGRSTPTSVASSSKPAKGSSSKVKVKAQSFTDLKAAASPAAVDSGAKKADRRRSAAAVTKPADKEDVTARGAKRKASSSLWDDEEDVPSKKALTKSRSSSRVTNLKEVGDLINEMCQRDEAWPFLTPVRRKDAPDYFDIIKTPMDLQTIKGRLNKLEYSDASEVVADIGLIFANCFVYNQPTAQQYVAGQKLQTFFKRRARELGLRVDSPKKEAVPVKAGGGRRR